MHNLVKIQFEYHRAESVVASMGSQFILSDSLDLALSTITTQAPPIYVDASISPSPSHQRFLHKCITAFVPN